MSGTRLLAVFPVFAITVFCVLSDTPEWISKEHQLMHDLMDKYTNDVRPVNKPSDKVDVQLGIALVHLDDLDETKGVLYLNTWLRMMWTDVQLQWNPSEYDNISHININIDKLWQPDIVLYNSFSDFSRALHNTLAVVYSGGTVLWIPPVFMASSCPIDLTDFPHDTQVCQLKFGSWTYHNNQVSLDLYGGDDSSLDTSTMTEHHELDLVKSEVSLNRKTYDCCPNDVFEDITYTLHFKRNPSAINHMLVLPSILFSLFLPMIFVLPTESDVKIQYGVGFLIVNTLLLLLLVNTLPAGHPTIPDIGHYHISNVILSCLALAVACYIRKLWTKGLRGSHMPHFVKNYILGLCGRLMCVSRDDYMPLSGTGPEHSMRKLEVMSGGDGVVEGEEVGNREDDREQILRNYAKCTQSADWKQLAAILDRLGFLVFFTMALILTIGMAAK